MRSSETNDPLLPAGKLRASHFRGVRRVVQALMAVAIALPTLYLAVEVRNDWYERLDAATESTVRSVSVAQQQAVKLFDIDATLIPRLVERVSHMSERQIRHSSAAVRAQMSELGAGYPQILSINVFSSSGELLVSSHPTTGPINVADRRDFDVVRAAPAILHISQPMVSRVTGVHTFNVAQGWTDARGRFGGLVSVSMNLAYYRDFFRDLRAPDSPLHLGLLTADAVPLVWYPDAGSEKWATSAHSALAIALRERSSEGALRLPAPGADHDHGRIVAYRRVGAYDAYVVAAWPITPLRAAWIEQSTRLVLTTLGPAAIIVLLLLLYLRRLDREEDAWRQLDVQRLALAAHERARAESQRLETLGNMVAMVAHDFNNVLMAIAAHTARGTRSADNAQQALESVEGVIVKGQALTRRLLGVARKQPLQPAVVDMRLWEGYPLLRSALGDSITFTQHVEADVWPIRVDAAELELALLNLAVNARDAMPDGGRASLRVGNARAAPLPDAPDREYVCLLFADAGNGMDAATEVRAFEPFFTTKPTGHGTGLGLVQVRAFCERAGGFVTLETRRDFGTMVGLYIPRAEPAAAIHVEPTATYATTHRQLRLLLVEDDPLVAQAQQSLFETMGHTVIHAGDAQTALATLEGGANSFDAVLSDVQLPGSMSGVRLAAEIRRRYPTLNVTLLTGFAWESLDGLESLDVQVFAKPCNPDVLERHLQQHAGRGADGALH
ncbi:response regulator [Paraburkholderia heleia]|uniref:response regulator n=1 Tax=Paraburkholderia heleia TaxID=634127 RepID=UPI0005A76A0A|nr:response regulator [Paraburkholderia heleia]